MPYPDGTLANDELDHLRRIRIADNGLSDLHMRVAYVPACALGNNNDRILVQIDFYADFQHRTLIAEDIRPITLPRPTLDAINAAIDEYEDREVQEQRKLTMQRRSELAVLI